MARKKDINKLLNKRLSGLEAGKLMIQDSWLKDRDKENLFSDAEVETIRRGILSPQDRQDFNQMIYTYEIIDFTFRETRSYILECKVLLWQSLFYMEQYRSSERLRFEKMCLPAIVTQEQLDDIKINKREEMLQGTYVLKDVIIGRSAMVGAPTEIVRDDGIYTPVHLLDLEAIDAELAWSFFDQALFRLANMINDGSLPLANKSKKDLARIRSLTKKYITKGFTDDEREEYLLLVRIKRKTLYEVLPEWREEPISFDFEDVNGNGVAVIQDPDPDHLDEEGGFIGGKGQSDYRDRLLKVLMVDMIEGDKTSKEAKELRENMPILLKMYNQEVKSNLKLIFSTMAIFENLSKVVGIDLTQELKEELKEVFGLVNWYNAVSKYEFDLPYRDKQESVMELPRIELDKLLVSEKYLSYLKERMSAGLGEDWYHETVKEVEWRDGSTAKKTLEKIKEQRGRVPHCWKWIEQN